VHETARLSTPETDVPVPPPAQDEVTAAAGIPQDRDAEPTEWWQTTAGKALSLAVVAVAVLVVLANLDAGVAIMLLAIGAWSRSRCTAGGAAKQWTPPGVAC
jgi:hypothetical protein